MIGPFTGVCVGRGRGGTDDWGGNGSATGTVQGAEFDGMPSGTAVAGEPNRTDSRAFAETIGPGTEVGVFCGPMTRGVSF